MDQNEPASAISTFQDLQHTHRVVIPGLSQESYTVLAAASSVRIYHAQSRSQEWRYSRLKGTLIFGKDNDQQTRADSQATSLDIGKYWFRVFDEASGYLKPVWVFKLPALGFAYELDRPFFHAFQGMVSFGRESIKRLFFDNIIQSRRFGFLFEDDDEAGVFHKDVLRETSRTFLLFYSPSDKLSPYGKPVSIGPGARKSRSLSFTLRTKTPPNDNRRTKGPISASMISVPTAGSFIHVAHVGLTTSGTIEASKGIDPSWTAVLGGYGVHDHTFSSRSPKMSDKRVDRVGGEGYWLVGQVAESSRRGVGAKEIFGGSSEQEGVSTNPNLQGRRRLPTPSFTMF